MTGELPVSLFKLKFTDQATISFYVFHGDMSLIAVKFKYIYSTSKFDGIYPHTEINDFGRLQNRRSVRDISPQCTLILWACHYHVYL